ncbi:MAG TPA: DUF4158 domain-containing protein [Baekduia sp.]|nr:DUF4158 domain-containing protein [Baekduia sp.]
MARDLGLDDVVDHFTLISDELDQLRNKSGRTRLGFAVLLKFLLWRGRFPRGLHEFPDDAVAHRGRGQVSRAIKNPHWWPDNSPRS